MIKPALLLSRCWSSVFVTIVFNLCGGELCVECCSRKECSGAGWLLAGVWKVKGERHWKDV